MNKDQEKLLKTAIGAAVRMIHLYEGGHPNRPINGHVIEAVENALIAQAEVYVHPADITRVLKEMCDSGELIVSGLSDEPD